MWERGGKYHRARARGEPGDTNGGVPGGGVVGGESTRDRERPRAGRRGSEMEGETNFGLREDVARGDQRLGRSQVVEGGGEWKGAGSFGHVGGIVNGQPDWDSGIRDASCFLL